MIIYHTSCCLNYELRLCWQVSSILQQTWLGRRNRIIQDIATLEGDELLLRPEGKDVNYYPIDAERFALRGIVRNEQIKRAQEAKADIIFFADADHVYPPDFFYHLALYMNTLGRSARGVATAPNKIVTEREATDALMLESLKPWLERKVEGPPIIDNAYQKALKLPTIRRRTRMIAGGNMQVVWLERIFKENNGLYVDPEHNSDKHMFKKWLVARSDKQFRGALGSTIPLAFPNWMIHLDHRRDKEEGKHLEIQR